MALGKWILALLLIFVVNAFAFDFPSSPKGRVSDYTGKLSVSQVNDLTAKLKAINDSSGHQIAAAVFQNMDGMDVESFTNKLYNTWHLGQKDKNDGILLVIALDERKVRIEVGYGLEHIVTDADSNHIIQRNIVPKLKSGDFAGAMAGFASGIADLVNPKPVVESGSREISAQTTPISVPWVKIALWFIGLTGLVSGFMIWLDRSRARKEAEERERERRERAMREKQNMEDTLRSKMTTPRPRPAPRPSTVATAAAVGVTAAAAAEERKRREQRDRDEEERRRKRRREEEEESSRRSSSNDDSFGGFGGGGGFDSFSGGGGSSGGGGASGSW